MSKKVKGKKKVLASVGVVAAAVCCFAATDVATSMADTFSGKPNYVVFAEEVTNWETKWTDSTTSLLTLSNSIATDQSAYTDYVTAYLLARDAYTNLAEKPAQDDPAMLAYAEAQEVVADEVDCYDYVTITLTSKLNAKVYWSDNAEYVGYVSKINGLSDFAKVDLSKRAVNYQNKMNEAKTEFDRIEGAIADAELTIANIEYVNMVDSKASLDVATEKLQLIYNVSYQEIKVSNSTEFEAMHTYVAGLSDYDSALAGYNTIVEECIKFDAKIVDLYNSFTLAEGANYNKYYTQGSLITAIKGEYDALNKGPNDDRTSLIKEYAKIQELLDSYNAEITAKTNAENAIALIPATFDYTNDYILEVGKARATFDLMSADLQSVAETEVVGYDVLIKAEEDIKICKEEVNKLIEDAKQLETLRNEGSASFTSEVTAVAGRRAKLAYDKQVVDFDAECGALLEEMQASVANLSIGVKPVIDAINAIGDVNLKTNPDIASQIENARDLYDQLETLLEKNAVTNYSVLTAKEEALSALMQSAEDWKASVLAIVVNNNILTVSNYSEIASVESVYEAFDADLKYVIAHSANYGYSEYDSLISLRTQTNSDIEALANHMNSIPTDLAVISSNVTDFTSAVEKATADLEKFHATIVEEYFTKDGAVNKGAYDNYVSALNIYNNVYKLVGNIIALGDGTTVTMLDYDNVNKYLAKYELLSDENKQIVIDGGYKTILDTAKTTVDQIKTERDAWIEKVLALAGNVEKDKWDTELYKVELDAITILESERGTFGLNGDAEYLAVADADLAKIKSIGEARVTDLNDNIDVLSSKAQLENDDIDTLLYIEQVYNKLDDDQKDKVKYAEFVVLYNKYISAQNFDKAVEALYQDVMVKENYTSSVPITIGILRSVYVDFSSEMKALIESYSKIQEIEDAYLAHVDAGEEVLNLTEVYNKLSESLSVDSKDFADQLKQVADKLAEVEKDYKDADVALKDAYEKADADLQNEIKKLQDDLNSLKTKLEDADEAIIQDIANVRKEIANVEDGFEKLVEDTKNELKDDIAELASKLDAAKAELTKADLDNKAELLASISDLEKTLNDEVAKLAQADVDNLATISSEIAKAKSELNKAVADLKAELEDEIKALSDKLELTKADLEKSDADNKAELLASISDLEKALNDEVAKLAQADVDNLATIRSEIAQAKSELNKAVTDLKAELEKDIAELASKLDAAKAELAKADLDNKAELVASISALEKALNDAKTELANADAENLASIRSEIENVNNNANAEIDNLEKIIEALEAELKKADADNKAELLGQIESLKKSLTIITSILGVVLLLTATGVILLTIKGKKH